MVAPVVSGLFWTAAKIGGALSIPFIADAAVEQGTGKESTLATLQ